MRPRTNQQLARATGATHAVEVGDGVGQEDVVPAADVEAGRIYLVVLAGDGQPLERLGLVRLCDAIEECGQDRLPPKWGELRQRKRRVPARSKLIDLAAQGHDRRVERARIIAKLAHQSIQAHLQAPVRVDAQL